MFSCSFVILEVIRLQRELVQRLKKKQVKRNEESLRGKLAQNDRYPHNIFAPLERHELAWMLNQWKAFESPLMKTRKRKNLNFSFEYVYRWKTSADVGTCLFTC